MDGVPNGLYSVGDAVEVWSNTHQVWCPGHVDAILKDGLISATFQLPITGSDNMATKSLPAEHEHLRKAGAPPGSGQLAGTRGSCGVYSNGDAVEVWSNSQRAWCPGYVAKISDGILHLAFRLPGAKPDDWSQKQLPIDHKDVRRSAGASQALGSGDGAGAGGGKGGKKGGYATDQLPKAPEDPKVLAKRQAAEKQLVDALKSGNASEVEQACSQAEMSGVDHSLIDDGRIKAVIFSAQEELRAAVNSRDPAWVDQACKRARDAGVPQKDIDPARAEARKLFARADLAAAAQCADADLLEEAIELAKEAGLPTAELEAARRTAEQNRAREAALRAEAARKAAEPPKAAPATGPAPFDTGMDLATDAEEAEFRPPGTMLMLPSVGDWVEVFSNTHKDWFLGRITKVTPEGPTVVFQLPGAGPDEWLEKVVPIALSMKMLRRPLVIAASIAAVPHRGDGAAGAPSPQWSLEESSAYKKAFECLLGGERRQMVSSEIVAVYLKGSGLPRKVLKQIWMVANPHANQELTLEDLSVCFRLVGHCQAVLTSGDAAAADLLVEGGKALKSLFDDDFVHKPPPALARFHGETLDNEVTPPNSMFVNV